MQTCGWFAMCCPLPLTRKFHSFQFLWGGQTGELVKKLRGDKFGGSQLAFTPDHTKLVVVGSVGLIHQLLILCVLTFVLLARGRTKFVVLDIESGSRLAKFDAHSSAAGCLRVFPTGVSAILLYPTPSLVRLMRSYT
jgi:hypothetical protein